MARGLVGENRVTVVEVAELCGVHTPCHTVVEASSPSWGQWGRRVHAAPTQIRGGGGGNDRSEILLYVHQLVEREK